MPSPCAKTPQNCARKTLELFAQLLACGVDPERSTLFVQSHVTQHAEIAWVLNCFTMFGELSRMTQFKDKSAKHADNVNAGLFTYPVLMAGDILLYQADLVPVGEDQKQHVEICRDIATRFNYNYGDVFTLPDAYIPKVGARVMSLNQPDSKMSKSIPEGCVYLMDKPDEIMRKFKRAITDSDTERCVRYDRANKPGVATLIDIYAAVTGKSYKAIEAEFEGKGLRCLQACRGGGCGGAVPVLSGNGLRNCWPTKHSCSSSTVPVRRRPLPSPAGPCARSIKRSVSWSGERSRERGQRVQDRVRSKFQCQEIWISPLSVWWPPLWWWLWWWLWCLPQW